jgi:hypothetical protein
MHVLVLVLVWCGANAGVGARASFLTYTVSQSILLIADLLIDHRNALGEALSA